MKGHCGAEFQLERKSKPQCWSQVRSSLEKSLCLLLTVPPALLRTQRELLFIGVKEVTSRVFYLRRRQLIDRWLSKGDGALQPQAAAPAGYERQRNGSGGDRLVTSNAARYRREQG